MKVNTIHITSESKALSSFIEDLYAKKAEKKAEMKDRANAILNT